MATVATAELLDGDFFDGFQMAEDAAFSEGLKGQRWQDGLRAPHRIRSRRDGSTPDRAILLGDLGHVAGRLRLTRAYIG